MKEPASQQSKPRPSHGKKAAPWLPVAPDEGGRRVLLAEDDFELRTLLAEELSSDGYLVTLAKNGYELMEAVARHTDGEEHFDAIITDIRMPGPEGMFALASLREDDWQTPVIVTTAFGDATTHEEARRLGAVRVLDKPFDYEELSALLDRVVGS